MEQYLSKWSIVDFAEVPDRESLELPNGNVVYAAVKQHSLSNRNQIVIDISVIDLQKALTNK
jgi:hypothetical protein